jgi:hypothetical protein
LGDRIVVRFVNGGTSSPRPRVLSIDTIATRMGLREQLRSLKKQVREVQRKLALDEAQRLKQGQREWKRIVAKTRQTLARHKRGGRGTGISK